MEKSLWRRETSLPEFKALEGDISTDVLVVGGGICGILCAHFLKENGVDYLLTEKGRICGGITQNTTAKITFLHGLIYSRLIKEKGTELAKMYFEANRDAVEEYGKISADLNCGFQEKTSFIYSKNNRKAIEQEVSSLNKLGDWASFSEKTELPFKIAGAVGVEKQAQFNPLMFLGELSKGLNIYENTFVKEITPRGAEYERGTIKAKRIIIATHFPFINRFGLYFLKLYQHRSYLMAVSGAQSFKDMYVDCDLNGMSFSSHGNYTLIGGGSHRTGKDGGCWEEIEKFAEKYYPEYNEVSRWATQDCMSLDNVPYIGMYSKMAPYLYVATGFNKWGMTSSMVSAKTIVADIIGKPLDYSTVFSPQRSMLKPQLAVNTGEALVNILSVKGKRCPHLGCTLKWNRAEHTWDCPCHGSRFEKDGRLIDNPATKNIDS